MDSGIGGSSGESDELGQSGATCPGIVCENVESDRTETGTIPAWFS
jgi:hypothetical protein